MWGYIMLYMGSANRLIFWILIPLILFAYIAFRILESNFHHDGRRAEIAQQHAMNLRASSEFNCLILGGSNSVFSLSAEQILQELGGFEIAAIAGAYIRCAQLGIPALVDGFITTAAALAACRMNPQVHDWLLFSHQSEEQGHAFMLEALKAKPLLSLGLRLGEGSGAAIALPLLRQACALHNGMATFAEAAVSEAATSATKDE